MQFKIKKAPSNLGFRVLTTSFQAKSFSMAPLLRSGAVDIPPQVTEEVILIEEVALGTDEGVLNLHDSAA